MTGLTYSEAQHRELVTGGDAYGTAGVVEDVGMFLDLSDAEDAADPTPEDASIRTDASNWETEPETDGGDTNKAALAALGVLALGAVAYGGSR